MGMDDIKNFKVTELLRNQQEITIRAVRPDDKGLVIEALSDLSDESIYRRLFTVRRNIGPEGLKKITEVDFENSVALVISVQKDGHEHLVGGGRYILSGVSGTGRKAEVAFLIADAFQGLGIASRVFKHLAAIAIASGVTQFEAEVLHLNEAMLRVFTRSGFPVTTAATRESVHVLIDLK